MITQTEYEEYCSKRYTLKDCIMEIRATDPPEVLFSALKPFTDRELNALVSKTTAEDIDDQLNKMAHYVNKCHMAYFMALTAEIMKRDYPDVVEI